LEAIAQVANMIHEHGAEAINGYCNYLGTDYAIKAIDQFEDSYRGCHDSEEDFAEEWLSDCGIMQALEDICIGCGTADQYLDMEAIARDFFINDFYSHEEDGKVYVFDRN
jgi:antirestriction protein